MDTVRGFIWVLDIIVVAYFVIYMAVNLLLLAISTVAVKNIIKSQQLIDDGPPATGAGAFYPLVSLIVPAYNEEVTIVDNIENLMRLTYPRFEIIVVNDGSKDATVELAKEAFKMVRSEVDYDPHLGSMPIRGFYRTGIDLPDKIVRLVLLDKENGGKADAINAGINASQGSYVASMDADSLLVHDAIQLVAAPFMDDPNRMVASGGQVALSNGCSVADGKVVEVNLAKPWIARFQVVEYMRSFTQSRTALGQLNSLLILSGVFALFQRSVLIAAGGFLTKHMRSRVGQEYCGVGTETVCEDMEVVVRLHRYLYDHGSPGRGQCLPHPIAWTEAPEVWLHLGKQRNRWYRGLLEVLWIHRRMMFNPRYGRIGLFSLPYQLFFEALAPMLELTGYLVMPLSWAVGLLSGKALMAFMAFALSFNLVLSAGSVLVAIRRIKLQNRRKDRALLEYRGAKNLVLLIFAGLLSNLGYRQYLLFWQLRGFKDFLAGRKSWDKFARKGFKQAS